MTENPLISVLLFGGAIYLLYLWNEDAKSNSKSKGSLPGTSYSRILPCAIASFGAIFIVGLTTLTELGVGVFENQSTLAAHFLLAMLAAAVLEEVIFRGYLFFNKRGSLFLVGSSILFSAIFALLHPYIWTHAVEEPSGLEWLSQLRLDLSSEAIIATVSIFTLSLWFYFCRLMPWNSTRSLMPCFFAHAFANIAVFIIKLTSGFIAW